MESFDNRSEAGKILAKHLRQYAGRKNLLVLALPRGGVPVAFEVAARLKAPLDVFLVRKLGLPGHAELAMGAIASGGVRVLNEAVVNLYGISEATVAAVAKIEQQELQRRESAYRGDRPMPKLEGRTVLLVDDGLATGTTMRAAIKALRTFRPERIVVAVPTAPAEVCEEFRQEVDDVVCVMTPEPFRAIGLWYRDFSQTTDEVVRSLLERAGAREAIEGEIRD